MHRDTKEYLDSESFCLCGQFRNVWDSGNI